MRTQCSQTYSNASVQRRQFNSTASVGTQERGGLDGQLNVFADFRLVLIGGTLKKTLHQILVDRTALDQGLWLHNLVQTLDDQSQQNLLILLLVLGDLAQTTAGLVQHVADMIFAYLQDLQTDATQNDLV